MSEQRSNEGPMKFSIEKICEQIYSQYPVKSLIGRNALGAAAAEIEQVKISGNCCKKPFNGPWVRICETNQRHIWHISHFQAGIVTRTIFYTLQLARFATAVCGISIDILLWHPIRVLSLSTKKLF